MLSHRSIRWLLWLGAVAAVMISGPVLRAQDQVRRIFVQLDDAVRQPAAPQHWLGLVCEPPSDVLRHHLGLAEGQGLVVAEVVKDSPAADKLQVHDVLLAAGDEPLKSVEQLSAAVEKAGEKEVTLSVQRGPGERITVQVKPGKRPADLAGPVAPGEDWWRQLRPMFDRFRIAPDGPLRMRIIQPGVIDPEKMAREFGLQLGPIGDLPEGLSVTITKQGDKPARIKVQRGDESWETTEDKLDALPEDVRGHVQGLLRPGLRFTPQGAIRVEAQPVPRVQPPRISARIIEQPDRFERRFKALEEKIEALQRLIEKSQEEDDKQ